MPATLKSLTEGSQALKVAYKDDPEAVTIWSSPLTPRVEREVRALSDYDDDDASKAVVPLMLALVKKWDFRVDDSKNSAIVPLTTEGLDDVPYGLMMAIVSAIMDDQSPKPPTEAPSSAA